MLFNSNDLNGNLEKLVRDNLCDVDGGTKVDPIEILPEEPYEKRERLNFEYPGLESTNVSIYFQIPPSHSLESSSITLLNYVLSGSFNSLLFKDVREQKGLVYSIGSRIEGHSKTGLLNIQYSVAPEHS